MSHTKRNCDHCNKEYTADNRNLKRGWGLTCSKSCAAKKREMAKPGYDPVIVARNSRIRSGRATIDDIREATDAQKMHWNLAVWGRHAPNIVEGDGVIEAISSEGYSVVNDVAYNRFGEAVYHNHQMCVMSEDFGWDAHKDY